MKRSARIWLVLILCLGTLLISLVAVQSLSIFNTPGPGQKVAVVRIEGLIADSKSVVAQLRKYDKDPAVKAVVIRINSPGGSVAPSQEIYQELLKVRRNGKKVVASMGSVAASGGYYVAVAADKIYANPGTITGSIGVLAELANAEELLKKIGIKAIAIKSGKHKDMGSFTRELDEEEKKLLQNVLDDIHGQFVNAVAAGRKLNREKVKALADGRIFSGNQAKDLALVDDLGNFQDAIAAAGEMAGIPGEPVVVEERKRSLLFRVLEGELPGGLNLGSLFEGGLKIKYIMPF